MENNSYITRCTFISRIVWGDVSSGRTCTLEMQCRGRGKGSKKKDSGELPMHGAEHKIQKLKEMELWKILKDSFPKVLLREF